MFNEAELLRNSIQERATELIDDEPDSFFIALAPAYSDITPPCVCPAKGNWLDAQALAGICDKTYETLRKASRSEIAGKVGPHIGANLIATLDEIASNLLADALNAHPNKPYGMKYQVQQLGTGAEHSIFLALGLREHFGSGDHACGEEQISIAPSRKMFAPASLTGAVIHEFFKMSRKMFVEHVNIGYLSLVSADNFMRSAGRSLLLPIGCRLRNGYYPSDCLAIFSAISSQYYEKQVGHGGFVLASRKHTSIEHAIRFNTPISITEYRQVRKLLELTSSTLYLHTDLESVFGLASITSSVFDNPDVFEISVLGHHHWQLLHMRQPMLEAKYGLPSFPKPPIDKERVRKDLCRVFRNLDLDDNQLFDLIYEAKNAEHGTTLLISEHAAAEADRLKTQAIMVNPVKLTPRLLAQLSKIDGAILISPDATCFAVGVILDGKATPLGDLGRGARYNSAVRYIENVKPHKCMAVIVSTDGSIDFVPTLQPMLSRKEIRRRINELASLETVPHLTYEKLLSSVVWLKRHMFYFDLATCVEINATFAKVDKRQVAEKLVPRVILTELTPSAELIEELYLED